ncbi:MAG TPA: NAD(P)/FAD-dependent oxidoreductase [Mycobacteriales bacterium]|nr:NAD(P)/FAD-dependent oxidoreductase [Mycobacteriales bacterium]
MTDAVVVGAGPNGLVAANILVDAGWSVVVLEAGDRPGGAVRSAEVTAPGFVNDLFSAFYPLAAASSEIAALDLAQWGLSWAHAPLVVAHPLRDGRVVTLSREIEVTAASLDAFAPGDGDAWRAIVAQFERIRDDLVVALFRPFPPVAPAVRLLRTLGTADALRFARFATMPLRRWSEENFNGAGATALLAGNALHTDLGPDSSGAAIFGWLLCMLGQTGGYPVPVGGAQALTDALVSRLLARGGRLECDRPVDEVIVRSGRAVGVRSTDGTEYVADRAVLAAVDAPQLFGAMVAPEHLPARMLDDLRRFQWDNGTVKVDWALSGPVPWADDRSALAGTVHLGGDADALTRYTSQLAVGAVPDEPYIVFGQMTTSDPTRSPAGTEAAWGYTHVPQTVRYDAGGSGITGRWDEREVQAVVDRLEAQVERFAPGFRNRIVGRFVNGPLGLQQADRNLFRGALNGGSAAIHQQLVWRPVPGLGRSETPVDRLYLASASAHPGGGVHGGPGGIAARTALRNAGLLGPARRGIVRGAHRAIYR